MPTHLTSTDAVAAAEAHDNEYNALSAHPSPPATFSVSAERAVANLQPALSLLSPRNAAIAHALANLGVAAVNIRRTVDALAGGEARVELLENYYVYVGNARLRTFVLRISGEVSGDVSEFVLPGNAATLASLPAQHFVRWVRAFERGAFGITDEITPAQRELLIDFARIWEGFALEPRISHGWQLFSQLLRWLVTDHWDDGRPLVDGGFHQLSLLSDWARSTYPRWFSDVEGPDDPEMPELVTVYGSSDSEDGEQ